MLGAGDKLSLEGAGAALAILAKYQALVMLSGIFVALAWSGEFSHSRTRRGFLLAASAAAIMLAPHVAGLAWSEHSPLRYVLTRMEDRPCSVVLRSLLMYLVSQLRFHLPILLAVALAAYTVRARLPLLAPASATSRLPLQENQRAWLIGLVAWPALITLLVPLATGMLFQAQWGLPALQFVVLSLAFALAAWLPHLPPAALQRAVLWAQLCSAMVFLSGHVGPKAVDFRDDPAYPARKMANAVLRDWKRHTSCPLKFVAGPSFEAGFVSIHAGGYPKVLEEGDFGKSPWIDSDAMQRHGYVSLALNAGGSRREPGAARAARGSGLPSELSWTIVPPLLECAPGRVYQTINELPSGRSAWYSRTPT